MQLAQLWHATKVSTQLTLQLHDTIIPYSARGFLSLFKNLSITALQHCVSFCSTTKRISYMWTYMPSHLNLLSLLPTPSSHPTKSSLNWAPCAVKQLPTSYFTRGNVYMLMQLTFKLEYPKRFQCRKDILSIDWFKTTEPPICSVDRMFIL